MNERIKELAEQAKAESSQWLGSKPATTITYDELEKFAELIVKECAALVKGQPHVDKMMDCNSVIKQHFGVNSNEITTAMLDTAIDQIEEYKKYVAQQQKDNLPHISYGSWELYNKPKKEQE